MRTKILSPQGVLYEGEAVSFNVTTKSGEITVLDHHHPLLTMLAKGRGILETSQGERREIPVGGGILEVGSPNNLTVLVTLWGFDRRASRAYKEKRAIGGGAVWKSQ